MPRPAAAVLLLLVRIVRWWFGLTYGLGGLWGLTWGFMLLFVGDSGEGAFLMFGGLLLVGLGWLIHPWGLH